MKALRFPAFILFIIFMMSIFVICTVAIFVYKLVGLHEAHQHNATIVFCHFNTELLKRIDTETSS